MNILVCITHVPDTTAKISFTDNNTQFNKEGVQFIIGPYDDYALAKAVEIKEQTSGSITVLNVGSSDSDTSIRKALAIGADKAVRINTEPQDSFSVAQEIASYCKENSFDLILMGRESIDYNGGIVHNLVGEILEIPSISPVMHLDINDNKATVEKEIDGGKQILKAQLPLVLGCQEPISEWKIPNMRGIMMARSKPLNIIEPQFTNKTNVKAFELPPEKSSVKIIDPNNVNELIDLLKNEAKVL
jgi:electron transfer flavoprotein beta subunit